jgi:hypothetical protein
VAVFVGVDVWVAVAVGVGVATGPAMALSAAPAFTIPGPQIEVVQLLPGGKGLAVSCRIWRLWARSSTGLMESISDNTPATCGAAMLVPW